MKRRISWPEPLCDPRNNAIFTFLEWVYVKDGMNYLVALGGLLMLVSSAMAMLAPQTFVSVLSRWSVNVRFSLTVGIRFLLGIIFLFGASQTRFPAFISTIGVITLAAAIAFLFLGRAKVEAIIQWWLHHTPMFMRMWAVVGVILSALIVYAGLG